MKQYCEREGNALAPQRYKTDDGYKLGTWVSNVRAKIGALNKEKKARLDSLGFDWDPIETQWEQSFLELKHFYEREGHVLISFGYKSKYGFALDRWVINQRKIKKSLSKEKIARLDSLGFEWNPLESKWEKCFSYLKQYYEREGNALVTAAFKTEDGFGLGYWVRSNRIKKDSLNEEKKARLDSLGFIWDTKKTIK